MNNKMLKIKALNIENDRNYLWFALIILPFWFLIYHNLQAMTDWFIDSTMGLTKGAHFTEALRFFVFEFPKVMLLLTLIIFFVGIIRTYFTPERTRKALEGKKTFTGNVMAASLSPRFVLVRPSLCF
jgi:uncharacterized membrane protein YraQ (UPF0718 family)